MEMVDIIKKAKTDEQAMEQVIKHMEKRARRYIGKRGYYIRGAQEEDFIQEINIEVFQAVHDYKEEYENGEAFLWICVKRKISAIMKKYNSKNKAPLNDALYLDKPSDKSGINDHMDVVSYELNWKKEVPSEMLASEMLEEMEGMLTENQLAIFTLYLEGYCYKEIADMLGKNTKQVDNAIFLAKQKIKQKREWWE